MKILIRAMLFAGFVMQKESGIRPLRIERLAAMMDSLHISEIDLATSTVKSLMIRSKTIIMSNVGLIGE